MPLHIATPGRAYQLLKKGSKLQRAKAAPKKYPANLGLLTRDQDEEEKKGFEE